MFFDTRGFRFGQATGVKRTPAQIQADIVDAQKKLQALQAQKAQKAQDQAALTQKLKQVQSTIAAIQAKRK
jgi:hypothetical protein